MRIRLAVHWLVWVVLCTLAWPAAAAASTTHLHGRTMGTTWSVQVVAAAPATAAWQQGIQRELDRVDGQMSTYRPQTELSRFNRARAGAWQRLSPEFFTVLQHALQLARDSDGAYDPTVGSLVNLWGFGPVHRPRRPPSAVEIAAARARVGWRKVQLDPAMRRARQSGGVALDLSSIAKGYAVDQVSRYLLRAGIGAALVEVGGELKGWGRKPDGTPWRAGVERPDAASGEVRSASELVRTVVLDGRAIATSGDYRHAYEDDGRVVSHHIDPRSGYPVPYEVASVSVLADDCMQADPLGTLLSVLGAERGMDYARAHRLAVLMVVRSAQGLEMRQSPAWTAAVAP